MRIKWSLEEAVALLEYFFVSRGEYKDSELQTIRNMMINRAIVMNIAYDEKFRNITGLRMQLGCIEYVVTDGKSGLQNAARIFNDAYDLFQENRPKYYMILSEFYKKYQQDIGGENNE